MFIWDFVADTVLGQIIDWMYGQIWCKHNGKPMEFDTMAQATEYADQLNKNLATMNVHYCPKEMEPEFTHNSCFSMQM